MAGKSKTISKGSFPGGGAKGGSGKMFGKQHAGPDKAGTSGQTKTGSGGKWAKGGSGHMFGKQHASARVPGRSGK